MDVSGIGAESDVGAPLKIKRIFSEKSHANCNCFAGIGEQGRRTMQSGWSNFCDSTHGYIPLKIYSPRVDLYSRGIVLDFEKRLVSTVEC